MAGLEKSTRIVQLKVRLLGLSPMIWRRVLVPESVMLRELHGILQVGMGWDGNHLYYFDIHAMRYGSLELHVESPDTPLSRFRFRAKDRFAYLYDMGDHWEHEGRIEKLLKQNPKKMYSVCTGGSRACPPEDCGGLPGTGNGKKRRRATMPGRIGTWWAALSPVFWRVRARGA